MTTGKTFVALVFLGLLAGCSKPCPRPGDVAKVVSEGPIHNCLYQLTITEIDLNNYLVKGKLPSDLDKKGIVQGQEYTFRVRDLDKLANKQYGIEKDKTYYFSRDGHGPYLEHYPADPKLDD